MLRSSPSDFPQNHFLSPLGYKKEVSKISALRYFEISRNLDFKLGEIFGQGKFPESEMRIWRDRGSDILEIRILQGKKKKSSALTRQYDPL